MIQIDWRDGIGILGVVLILGGLAWIYFPAAVVPAGVGCLGVYYLLELRGANPPAEPPSNPPGPFDGE